MIHHPIGIASNANARSPSCFFLFFVEIFNIDTSFIKVRRSNLILKCRRTNLYLNTYGNFASEKYKKNPMPTTYRFLFAAFPITRRFPFLQTLYKHTSKTRIVPETALFSDAAKMLPQPLPPSELSISVSIFSHLA